MADTDGRSASESTVSGSESASEKSHGTGIELVAVVIMSLTAILSAWSGFQAAKWGGLMSISFSEAGAARTESTRSSAQANQELAIDVGLFSSWAEAYARDETDLADFYYERMPDRLRVATDAWLVEDPIANAAAPGTPFVMEAYVNDASGRAEAKLAEAEGHAADARDHNQQSDDYVVLSVLFATVLFFAAFSTKLRRPRAAITMATMAAIALMVGVYVIARYPIEY